MLYLPQVLYFGANMNGIMFVISNTKRPWLLHRGGSSFTYKLCVLLPFSVHPFVHQLQRWHPPIPPPHPWFFQGFHVFTIMSPADKDGVLSSSKIHTRFISLSWPVALARTSRMLLNVTGERVGYGSVPQKSGGRIRNGILCQLGLHSCSSPIQTI